MVVPCGCDHAGMIEEALLAAFTRARQAAESHMAASEADDASWHEETVTDLVLRAARPRLAYHAFNRRQEAQVGADWLWWWVEAGGECFGMLVQAKWLHRRGDRLEVDLRADRGAQMGRLLAAADVLGVPAMYAFYLGTAAWRAPITCGVAPHPPGCLRCRRATLSILTGLQAELCSPSPRDAATAALTRAVPLEDLADPACDAEPVYDVNLDHLDGPLRVFLLQQQTGARAVARTVMAMLAADRRGQYSLDVAEREQLDLDAVFTELPDDTGHFAQPYFPHVLRGLRTRPPDYLDAALAGDPPPSVAAHADGIVVVRL
jgi:hypothetical protein